MRTEFVSDIAKFGTGIGFVHEKRQRAVFARQLDPASATINLYLGVKLVQSCRAAEMSS